MPALLALGTSRAVFNSPLAWTARQVARVEHSSGTLPSGLRVRAVHRQIPNLEACYPLVRLKSGVAHVAFDATVKVMPCSVC